MHCLVIQIGTKGVRDIIAVALSFGDLAEVLLLIHDEVFGTSDDTGILDTLDGLGHQSTSQNGIRRETLPVAATLGEFAQRTGDRPQLNVDSLVAELLAHRLTAEVSQLLIPSGSDVDTGREGRNMVG